MYLQKRADSTRTKLPVFIAFFLFFLFSSFLLFITPYKESHFDRDSYGYDRIAFNFAENNRLEDMPGIAPIQTVGYPFFVGILFTIFGRSVFAVLLAQILLMGVTLWLLYLFVSRIAQETTGLIALYLAVFTLGFIVYPQLVLAESVLVFCLVYFLERISLFFVQKNKLPLLQAGGVLSFSVLIKPSFLLFIPTFGLILLCVLVKKRLSLWFLLLYIAITTIPIFGYLLRNYHLYHTFKLAPMTELNVYQVYFSKALAYIKQISVAKAIQEIPFTGLDPFDSHGWQQAKTYFYHYLFQYPGAFIYIILKNTIKTLFGLYSSQLKMMLHGGVMLQSSFFAQSGTVLQKISSYITGGVQSSIVMFIVLSEVVFNIIKWLLTIIGFIIYIKKKEYIWSTIFLVLIVQGSVITFFDGCARYRMTFEPILIILSAITIQYFFQSGTFQQSIIRSVYEKRIANFINRCFF